MKSIFLALCFLLMASPAQAATYWVSKSGSDANACFASDTEPTLATQSRLTIGSGLTCLSASDTLRIKVGTYAEQLTNGIPSGSASVQTTIRAATGEVVTIQPSSGSGSVWSFTSARSYITFSNLVFDAANLSQTGTSYCFKTNNTVTHTNIIFENNECKNGTMGVLYASTTTGSVRYNYFHDLGHATSSTVSRNCMYMIGSNITFEYNRCEDVLGYGVTFNNNSGSSTGGIIRYNFFKNVGGGGTSAPETERTINISEAGALIHDNLIIASVEEGIRLTGEGDNAKVYHNTIYGAGAQTGIYVNTSADSSDVRNNIILNHATQINNLGTNTTLSDNLTTGAAADIFINTAGDDFNLKEASAGIDNAASISGFTAHGCIDDPDEADGAGTCDQGAFEAPVRLSAVVENATPTKYSVSFSMPSQSVRSGVGLQTCTVGNWDVQVAGSPATENSCAITGTGQVDITLASAVTNGQSLTDAMTRSVAPTLSDNVCIGDPNTSCKNAKVRSHTAKSGTNNVGGGAVTFTSQHYRCLSWYADTSPSANDWLRSEDADNTNADLRCPLQPGGKAAVAIALSASGAATQAFEWHVNRNGGAYDAMTNTSSATALGFVNGDAPGIANLASIGSAILTAGAGSYVAGVAIGKQASQPSPSFAAANDYTHIILLIASHANTVVGDYMCIQAAKAGGTPSGVTQTKYPCFQIVNPAAGF